MGRSVGTPGVRACCGDLRERVPRLDRLSVEETSPRRIDGPVGREEEPVGQPADVPSGATSLTATRHRGLGPVAG